ncbi:hypothetical protein D3C77_153430 [compost metagenome]
MALDFDDLPDEPGPQSAVPQAGGLSFDDLPDEPEQPVRADGGFDPMHLYYGAARSVDQMGLAAGRVLGIPAAQAIDTVGGMFSDRPFTAAQDFLNQRVLTPLQQRSDSLAPAPDAPLSNKVLSGVGGMAGNLAAMLATGGLSRAPALAEGAAATLPRVLGEVGQATRTMAVPATVDAINTGHDVYAQTAGIGDALKAAIASGAANIGMGLLPAALPGNLATRLATGAPIGALTGEATRQLRNMAMPDSMQQPFNTEDAIVNGLTGTVLAGALGRSPDPQPVREQPAPLSMQQPAQQPQGMAMPEQPLSTSPAQPQRAPAPQPVPFARSADISPLLDNLGVQGAQRDDTLALLQPVESEVDAKRRGVLPMTEQKRLASLIGLQGESADVFARKIGQAHNAEQIMAMTNGVSDQLKSVLEHQQKIANGQASDLDRASFVQQIADLRANFGDLMGARAESGRALAAQRRTVSDFKQAQAILEGIGGVQGADDLATALGAAVKAGGVGNASRLISKPESTMQRLLGYYFRSALLSGVRTHAVNITSNTLTLGNEMIERSLAAGIGGAKRLATGGKAGQTLFAEPLDLLIGMAKGSAKAGTAALDAFKTGESAVLGGQAKQDNALGLNNSPRKPGALNALAYGADKLASIPYRALGAEDAFFATLNYEGELRTLARQQAVAERKTGALPKDVKLSQRIEQIVQDPTAQMIEAAGEHARVQTFNQKAGTFAQAVMSAKAKAPWLNLIAPFIRTPANIVKFGLKRTPLAPFFKDVRADFAAGGARQERAAARILWGSSIMIGAGALAQAGYISGAGPDDRKEREALEATGWRPYSVRVGDTWHEYNRLDPFSQWLGLAADMSTLDYQGKNGADVAANVLGSLVNNSINKTYVQGVSNFVEFLQDPKRNGEWYLRQMGGTLAQPLTLLSNIASEQDPYARSPDSVLDQIKYRLPGLRNDLPTKLDKFGEPVPNRSYPGGPLSIAAPIAQSQQTDDLVRREASLLQWAPSSQQDHFTVNKQKHVLTAAQVHERDQLTGQIIHRNAESLMRSPSWESLDDDQRRQALDQIVTRARSAVKIALIPWITHNKRDALDRLRATLQQPPGERGEQ